MMPHYKSIFSSHEVRVLVLRTTPFKVFCEDQKRQILKIALGATHSHLLKFLVYHVTRKCEGRSFPWSTE